MTHAGTFFHVDSDTPISCRQDEDGDFVLSIGDAGTTLSVFLPPEAFAALQKAVAQPVVRRLDDEYAAGV